jgi:hypothetical protein
MSIITSRRDVLGNSNLLLIKNLILDRVCALTPDQLVDGDSKFQRRVWCNRQNSIGT